MPSHLPNDRTTERKAGTQTSATCRTVGTPSMSARTSLSLPEKRRLARRRGGADPPAAGTAGCCVLVATGSAREDGLGLRLDVLGQPVDVLRVLDEGLE